MKKLMTIFLAFLKIGAFTFGGGYAMIALLENELIEKKKWIEHDEFLNMVAVAESTPGPIAINSATLAVCIPSFLIIYCISLFLERFLSLTYVACAFKGIQVCVIYLILSTGIQMLKTLEKNWMNVCILCAVMAAMLICSVTAVSFSSVFYVLICGAAGVFIYFLQKVRKETIDK